MAMTAEKVIEVVESYKDRVLLLACTIRDREKPPSYSYDEALEVKPPSQYIMLQHAYDMCDKTIEFAKAGRMPKAFRWLGFLQGVLWAAGVFSINEMKDHNRPPEPVESW